MKKLFAMAMLVASLASLADVTRNTKWYEIPDETPVSNVVDLASSSSPAEITRLAANQVTNDVAAWALKPNEKPQGMSTNAVKAIINDEVGGTNTIVHSLAPATNYTDAASNNLATAIAEKRGLVDLVVYTNGFTQWEWYPTSEGIDAGLVAKLNEECRAIGSPQWDGFEWRSLYLEFTYNGVVYHWADDGLTPLDKNCTTFNYYPNLLSNNVLVCGFNASRERVNFPTESIIVTADTNTTGLAKLGADGVLTAATEADVPGLDGKLDYTTSDSWKMISGLIGFTGSVRLWSTWDYISVADEQTLPQYLASLDWCPSSATLSGYGITDAKIESGTITLGSNTITPLTSYTETDPQASTIATNVYFYNVTGDVENISAPVATNAATSVVSNYLDYALTNLAANTETFSLSSGVIANLALDSSHTNINLTLLYPASNERSADILLRVINAADTTLAVNSDDTDVDGTDWTSVKTGTNYVMATRTAYEGGRSKVLVSVKGL